MRMHMYMYIDIDKVSLEPSGPLKRLFSARLGIDVGGPWEPQLPFFEPRRRSLTGIWWWKTVNPLVMPNVAIEHGHF